ncbi:RNase A-like domain-containing protein [Serratia rubidaea]|uniref:RNase A-like domain-containing protein n=1 Tax=Serratia rubidaea TaxID=61652 RepID=UPI003FA36266
MAEENGLRVVLSPVQLAAAMSDKSVTEGETLSNRLLGGLGLAGGVIELIGAGAMCYAPDPTLLTKVGCVIVGTHSMDSIKAASNQMITGQPTTTDSYQSAVSLAKTLGADDDTAYRVGLTVDIAVPLAFAAAIGAVRVAAVRMGRVKLIMHESMTGVKPGGHTIARHVGLTKEQLAERLKNPRIRKASSFNSLRSAEIAISSALKANKEWIRLWAINPRGRPNLELTHIMGTEIGYGLAKDFPRIVKTAKLKVILHHQEFNGKPYFILTAFPDF